MPVDHVTFGTSAYAVAVSTEHGYAYIMRLADRAVTHLSAISMGDSEARALYEIYSRDPEQFEAICHRQEFYPAPKWRLN